MGEPIIVKLHGCSGAGKTTIARHIMENAAKVHVVTNQKGGHEAYVCEIEGFPLPLAVLGSYQNACGGMDTVSSQDEAIKLIDYYHGEGCHVFHEGLLQSTYYGKMGQHSVPFGDRYIYAFLMTPIDVCLSRVEERRRANNSTNKFNPELTIDKWNTINRLRGRVRMLGHNVYEWDSTMGTMPQIRSLYLKEGN